MNRMHEISLVSLQTNLNFAFMLFCSPSHHTEKDNISHTSRLYEKNTFLRRAELSNCFAIFCPIEYND